MTSLLDRPAVDNAEVRGWILAALVKLVSQTGLFPEVLRVQVEKLKQSRNADSQQRAYELLALKAQPAFMRSVLPLDSSLEDLEVDPDMGFLDGFVQVSVHVAVCVVRTTAKHCALRPHYAMEHNRTSRRLSAEASPRRHP